LLILSDTWRYLQDKKELVRKQKKKGCGNREEIKELLSTDICKMMLEEEKEKLECYVCLPIEQFGDYIYS
jgi:hypothetical protein